MMVAEDSEMDRMVSMLTSTLPMIQQLFPLDVMFAITDREKFIYDLPGKELNASIIIGSPIPPGAAFRRVLETGKPILANVPKTVYGVPFKSSSIPIKDNDGKTTGGSDFCQ